MAHQREKAEKRISLEDSHILVKFTERILKDCRSNIEMIVMQDEDKDRKRVNARWLCYEQESKLLLYTSSSTPPKNSLSTT